MYKVRELFTDLSDNSFRYEVGDLYPRAGYEPPAERIEELSTDANKRGRPLIIEIKTRKKKSDKTAEKEDDKE